MTCVLIDTIPRWSGGYLAHLKGILTGGVVPDDMQVIVHCTKKLREAIGPADRQVEFVVDDTLPLDPVLMRLWRVVRLPRLVELYSPDVHFSPGGHPDACLERGFPHVTMSRNLQPHVALERRCIPFYRPERIRLEALHRTFLSSFQRADGVIFLTDYARETVLTEGVKVKRNAVIPHGLSDVFRRRPERTVLSNRANLLYVSDIHAYKHQWEVIRAVDNLRRETAMDLTLHLVGSMTSIGRKLLGPVVRDLGNPDWLQLTESVPYSQIHSLYHKADVFVFASTVETFGNVLLEAMASGLPIACSNRRPMTDMLGDGGVFFEPEDPSSIASAVRRLLEDDELRYRCALNAYNRAIAYSWERTARETYGFIRDVANSKSVRIPRLRVETAKNSENTSRSEE
jgi:glycosyltransferase involved in cell wall biosynthesis